MWTSAPADTVDTPADRYWENNSFKCPNLPCEGQLVDIKWSMTECLWRNGRGTNLSPSYNLTLQTELCWE